MLQRPTKYEAGLRNAANSLQIEGKGVLPGDPYHWGVGTRNTRPYIHIHMYIVCIYISYVCMYLYIYIICMYIIYICISYIDICSHIYIFVYTYIDHICIYILYMCIIIYIYIYVYMYVYIYI